LRKTKGLGLVTRRNANHPKDFAVNLRIILKTEVRKNECERVDWIPLIEVKSCELV
jgi:hypothetical protein